MGHQHVLLCLYERVDVGEFFFSFSLIGIKVDSSHASYNQIEELLFAKSHLDGACEGEELVSMGIHSFTVP